MLVHQRVVTGQVFVSSSVAWWLQIWHKTGHLAQKKTRAEKNQIPVSGFNFFEKRTVFWSFLSIFPVNGLTLDLSPKKTSGWMVVGWNHPAPFLGEIPGLDPWIRSGSSASSVGRKKPWRNGCRAWGTTNCKRRRPGGGVMTRIFSMFFETEKMGTRTLWTFVKPKQMRK